MSLQTAPLVACPDCDLLQRAPALERGGCAECVRCGSELFRHKPHSIDHTLAFLIAAAIVFAFANAFPLMALDANGLQTRSTLLGTAEALYEAGMPIVGTLVVLTAIVFPALELAGMLYLLLPLRLGVVPPGLRVVFRLVEHVRPWGMVEVFILGALVAFVKLKDFAHADALVGFYALGGFVMLLTAADASFEPRTVWRCARSIERERALARAPTETPR